jgi:tRNA1Val (adenine37-N6)-methyltransferase
MSQNTFAFKQFTITQDKCAMKVGTDAVLLGSWVKTYGVRKALDIGTGTGVIALMIAQKCGCEIDAIDIDRDAAEEADLNVQRSPWKDRIHVQHVSLQDFARMADQKYDLIVSNPPYFVGSLQSSEANRTAARHTVLLSFEDLIAGARKLLNKEGKLNVILPVREGEQFIQLAAGQGLHLRRITRVKSTPDKIEKRWLMQFGFQGKPSISDSTLVMEKDPQVRHSYTDEYKELTKDYYLQF